MKKTIKSIIGIAVLLAMVTVGSAQDTNPPAPPSGINIPSNLNLSATNWVLIPFGSYDITTKKIGGGVAALYEVNNNFWTGLRYNWLDGQKSQAGVQAQLQANFTFAGVTTTPFVETSVGIGDNALFGSAGPGALIHLGHWTIASKYYLDLGIVGDYEHYVTGSKSGDAINAGPLFHISFP